MIPLQLLACSLRVTAAVLRVTADLLAPPRTEPPVDPPALLGVYVGPRVEWRHTGWAYATSDGVSVLPRVLTDEQCEALEHAGLVVRR